MEVSTWFLICVGLSAVLILLRLIARRAEKGFHKRLDDDIIYGVDDIPYDHRLAQMRDKFRADGTPPMRDRRPVGKHPALGMPYGHSGQAANVTAHHRLTLTPRQLERVNIQRKLQGRAPLNRAGFSNAVSHAWDQPRKQPDTTSDWLTYLIMYEVFFADHQSSRVSCDTGITISPDQPYNGQGGGYGGAGASGDWTSAPSGTAAVAAAIALAPSYTSADPLSDPGSYKGGDVSSSDTSSSYSSPSSPDSSSSSSSYDSGSSSSDGGGGGGGDSGGGGGGD